MDATVIALDGVVRRFVDVTALDGVDLRVERGEVVGLLGHNGAGKTTTVRTIAGVLPPDDGTARVLGLDPVDDGPRVRARLGVLPAKPIVDSRLTAEGNLRLAAELFGVPRADVAGRIDDLLHRFELGARAHERVDGFSTGMRQRLSLARVLLHEPDVLLLDEPTSALDPVAARGVRDLLADLARGHDRTIVICTHDLHEAEQLCDRVVVLERGRVVAAGTPQQLRQEHGQAMLHVQLRAADTGRALALLEPLELDVTAAPPGVHVALTTPETTATVVRVLVEGGVDVLEARREQTSLEDVYLRLHATRAPARQDLPPPTGPSR